jgi:hypothetical protein
LFVRRNLSVRIAILGVGETGMAERSLTEPKTRSDRSFRPISIASAIILFLPCPLGWKQAKRMALFAFRIRL